MVMIEAPDVNLEIAKTWLILSAPYAVSKMKPCMALYKQMCIVNLQMTDYI